MKKNLIKAEMIEKYIKNNKLTKKTFCLRCGISKSTLSKIINEGHTPRLSTMLKIRENMDERLDNLLNYKNEN